MEVLLVTLVIPALGALLLVAEWQRRTALGREARRGWRIVLRAAGIALFPIAAGLTFYACVRFLEFDIIQSVLLIGRLLLVGVAAWAGYRAVLVAARGDEHEHSLHRQHPADNTRVAAWTLVAFPLFWLAATALVLIAPLLYVVGVAFAIRRADRGRLLWIMAIAVENGLDLADELEAFAMGFRLFVRNRLYVLASRLRDGSTLSEALESAPRLLPAPVVMAIRVGEQTGTLATVLRDCAVRDAAETRQTQLDGSLAAMMSYYWVVMVTMGAVLVFLCYWIVPKFQRIFEDFGVELPLVTKRVLALSDLFGDYFWLLLPLVAVPITAMLLMTYAYLVGWPNLNWPLLMRWFPRRDAPGVLRGLALAVASGRPLPPLVADLAAHHVRRDLSARLARVSDVLATGEHAWDSLSREGFITHREVEALAAAARTQHLPFAMESLADSMDRVRRQRLLWWIEFCRPLVVLVFGWLVALYSVAFFLPLVQLIKEFVWRM